MKAGHNVIVTSFLHAVCVLIKHCKPNQSLDSSGCLTVTSVCFMFVFGLTFYIFLVSYCTVASYSREVSCKRY